MDDRPRMTREDFEAYKKVMAETRSIGSHRYFRRFGDHPKELEIARKEMDEDLIEVIDVDGVFGKKGAVARIVHPKRKERPWRIYCDGVPKDATPEELSNHYRGALCEALLEKERRKDAAREIEKR